ncbi:hypothetical protein AB0D58_34085 [Streptomyces sp. NPDC048210]|uniref:hypothetical protein n=1 Tax=Streptomyces sp. NPDC048210 TaxID=3156657 RepID=UPI0034214656
MATALVTRVATGWLVMPRLEARKRRILEAHQARDQFLAAMLRILSAGARLRNFAAPAADDGTWTPVMRKRVEAERARWVKQLDASTAWMVDNMETYTVSWPSDFLRGVVGTYVPYARAVVISEREETRKAEPLEWLTTPVWEVFGSRGWQRSPGRMRRAERQLAERIQQIEAEVDRQNTPA